MITSFVWALGFLMMGFAIGWVICLRVKNYGLLDVIWSYSVAIIAPLYALTSHVSSQRKWLITGLGVAWSLRLGTSILLRVLKHHPQEDIRYATLRERWPSPAKFLFFFELQAIIAAVFSLPFLVASYDLHPALRPLEWVGLAVAFTGVVGESLADFQLAQFKKNSAIKNSVCQDGLWRYSRHPNYFFESLVWWGFFLATVASPWGWLTLACPLLMLYFLLRVTGIPLTETHSLQSKGEAYLTYQRSTSAFIPWFRKS